MSEKAENATPTIEAEEPIGATTDFENAFNKAMGATPKQPEEAKAKLVTEPVKSKDEPKEVPPKPEPKELPPKPEVKPEAKVNEFESTAGMSPKVAQRFDFIKAGREEFKAKAVELENKVKELAEQLAKAQAAPKSAVDENEYKTIKEEHAKLSEEIKRLSVERHPRFKAHFGAKEESIVNSAKNAVGTEKAAIVEALLKQSPSEYRTQRLEELAEDLSSLGQARLSRAIDDWDNTQAEKKTAIETEAARWDKTQAEEKASQQQQVEGIKTKFEGLAKLALEGSKNYDAFKEIDGDTEHNAKVANNREFVKKFMSGTLKEEVFAFTPVLAAEALHLKEKVLPALKAEMASEIAKRDAIIKDLQASTPSVDVPADKGGKKGEDEQDFSTVFAANWKGG